MFCLDASVWINATSPNEAEHAYSDGLLAPLTAAQDASLVEPLLLPVEVAGAVVRTRGDAALARSIAEKVLSQPAVQWVVLDDRLMREAVRRATDHKLRGADAVNAAVAALHACPLVTLDREQLDRLPPAVETLTPRQACDRLGITVLP